MKPWHLFRVNRDLRWLFCAQVVSFAGDWFAYVALAGKIYDLTNSKVLVSLIYVLQSLPAFFASPIAGPTVDHFDRRKIIMSVSCVQVVGALGMLLVRTESTVPVGFVCVAIISAFGAFVMPAAQAAVPNLARSPEETKTAATVFGATWGVMLAVGTAAGGLFADKFGYDASFVANAMSFALAIVFVALVKSPMQSERTMERARMRPLADMAEAARYARRDHVLLALLASKTTFAIGSGTVTLLVLFATEELHGGDSSRGFLLAARGVGVAAGPIIGARFVGSDLGRLLTVCGMAGLIFGGGYVALSAAQSLGVALVLIGVAHLGGGAQWTLSTYGLQVRAPDDIRGRILAGDFAIVTFVLSASGISAGIVAELTDDLRLTMVIFAVIALAAAVLNLALTRPLRTRLSAEARLAAAPTTT
jgi:MFS family permease